MSKEFKVTEKDHFTTSKLVEFLNEKYKGKKTGIKFKVGDIQQYIRRGFLPKPYGHHPLSIVENKEIGIKLIKVDFDNKVKATTPQPLK